MMNNEERTFIYERRLAMLKRILVVLFLLFAVSISVCESDNTSKNAYGELNLHSIYEGHPEAGRQFFRDLTYDNAFNSLIYIRKEIDSCQELMKEQGMEDLEKNIGTDHHYYRVLFTMMKQNYLINKLEYNIAEYKHKLKQINETELKAKLEKYKKAKRDFEKHYNSISFGE